MKNLIFKKDKLSQRLTLIAYDSDFFNVVSGVEKHNFFPKENGDIEEASGNVVGDIKDREFFYEKRTYYCLDRYDDLNQAELRAVVDTHNEMLIRFVLTENEFTTPEIDDAFDCEDVYALLKT